MAESKIIIQVLLDDKASDPLKKVESGLSGVNKETEKFNEHEKERERLQKRIIKATSKENIELKQLELRLQMANKRALETAKARINAAEGQDMFAKSMSRTTGALKQNRAQSGLNNAILIELGRTASDAQYGFQGMANNIGRLVELGQEFARTGGGGLGSSIRQLGKSILGGGGVLIAIQLLISFLPTIQKRFKKWRDGTKGVTEAQKELTKTLDDLIKRGEDNNNELAKQEKLLNNAGDVLTRLGHKYKEDSDRKGRARAKQNEYNRSVDKAIAIFEQYGIQVDKARLKDDEYIKSLVGKGETIEKIAKEIYALQTELEVGQILGAFDPVEQAERELQLYIKQQELVNIGAEKYTKTTEYAKLVAKVQKAKNDVAQEASEILLESELSIMTERERELKEREIRYQEELLVLKKAGVTDLTAFEEEYRIDLLEINKKYDKAEVVRANKNIEERKKLYKQFLKDLEKARKDAEKKISEFQERQDELGILSAENTYADRLYLLTAALKKEEITEEEFAKKKLELDRFFVQSEIDTLKDKLKEALTAETVNGNEVLKIKTALFEKLTELLNLSAEEEKATFAETLVYYNQLSQELFSAVGSMYDAEIQREERKTTLLNNQLQERLNNEKLTAKQREAINKQIEANEVKLAKKRDEIAEKQFKLNKAASIANALVSTYEAGAGVLADTKGGSFARIAGMILVISTGLAQVAAIARQQFVPTALPSGSADGAAGGGVEAPDFNVVGVSEQSQLAQTVAGAEARPVRAFVVGKDVSTQQELDRNITNTASFG